MSKTPKLDLSVDLGGQLEEDHPARRIFTQEPNPPKPSRSILRPPEGGKGSSKASAKRSQKIPQTGEASLKRTDRLVLDFLKTLLKTSEDSRAKNTCTASNREIAEGAGVSPRQVQISIRRLIKTGMIARVKYDFSNPDRELRGTTYRILS